MTAPDSDQVVAALAGGGFVVTWQSQDQDGSVKGIYAQRYNAAGVAQGAEFRVNDTVAGNQQHPDIAVNSMGRAVVTWLRGNEQSAALLARPYTVDGPAGRAIEVTGADASRAGGFPQVALAGDGLVFAWTESGPEPRVRSVYARLR